MSVNHPDVQFMSDGHSIPLQSGADSHISIHAQTTARMASTARMAPAKRKHIRCRNAIHMFQDIHYMVEGGGHCSLDSSGLFDDG